MTMDDESSVYVGGLSYDTTEDSLRQKFEAFGPIVTVKNVLIIIDRDSGNSRGYGFVTFTNPRAATKAINGMDGGSLEGRTIRVNDVMNKNGRNFGRENGHYGTFRDRGRGRDNRDFRIRDRSGNSNARQFSPPRNRRLSSRAFHSDRDRLPMHHRSHSPEGGYSPSRSVSPGGRREDPNSDSPSPSPQSPDRLQDTDAMLERQSKSGRKAAKGREDDVRMIKVELERANQRRDELRIKAASLEEENVLKEQQIVDLQNESQKLEEAFSNAVAAASQKQNQLQKLQKAFLQVRNYTKCLQYSEKVLQALVNGASFEVKGAGTELHEKHGSKAWLESEDMEWKDDDDGGHVNIDD